MHIKRYQSWILAGISGILLILSFPSFNLFLLGWISLIPMLIALQSTSSRKSAFLHGYLTGAIFFLGLVYWIALLYPFANIFLTTFACLLLASYLALYVGVFGLLFRALPWKSGLTLYLHGGRNLDGIGVGTKLVFEWFSVGQHGVFTVEQPTGNSDCVNYRCARREFHRCPPQRHNCRYNPYLFHIEKPIDCPQNLFTFHVSRFTPYTHCDRHCLYRLGRV